MKTRFFSFVVGLALAFVSLELTAATYYVATDGNDGAAGTEEEPLATVAAALAKNDVTEVVIGAGTYAQSAVISLTTGVTVRGKTGVATDVTLDFQEKSQGFSINHASAVVQDLRIYRGQTELNSQKNGGGVVFGANGGILRNCIVDSCRIRPNTSSYGGGGIYIDGGALVTGCVIKNILFGQNTDAKALGVLINNGTLERSLVVGCRRDGYRDGKGSVGAVVLTKGTVDRCTIVGNEVMTAPLSVASDKNCTVRDTIVWGNVAFRELGPGRPNVSIGAKAVVSGLCTTGSFGTNPLDTNPSFIDAANGDYRLSPASPCRGAGTGGCDLGYADYDPATAKAGIRVSAYKGNDEIAVDVALMTREGVGVKSVTWEGLSETGASIRPTFGVGNHTLAAHVVYSDDSTGDVTLRDAVKVCDTGTTSVSSSAELEAALAVAGDGATILLAENNYELSQLCYYLLDGIRLVGTGLRENTVLTKKKGVGGRFFFLGNENASVCNITLKNGSASCLGGGVWIADGGGMVSNCVVTGCSLGASQSGGGVYMNASKALLTHSLVKSNTSGTTNGKGGGVCLDAGTVQNCVIVKNICGNGTGNNNLGGGIYMGTSTDQAKVINCTVADNTAKTGGGIYRLANAGFVYNTIVFGNTVQTGIKDFYSAASGTARPTATSVSHCCSSANIGAHCQTAASAPYDTTTYELTAASTMCIDLGCNDYVTAETDYVGANRIFKNIVDIGAYEYSKVEIVASFTSDKVEAAGKSTWKFTANLSGVTGDDWTCAWYLDGSASVSGTGKVWESELDVGRHTVRLVVTYNSTEYPCKDAQTCIVYPTDAYVDVGTLSIWPYDTPENAATNVNVAVADVLRSGVTLHVAPGSYSLTNGVSVGAGRRIVGAGADATVFYRHPAVSQLRVMTINGTGAWVEGVCVSNGAAQGGGLFITGDGGTFTRGRISKCKGSTNVAGGGALMNTSAGVISRTVFENNETEVTEGGTDPAGVNYSGGGISMSGGLVENCLFLGNKAKRGGAVDLGGGRVRNCTIGGNVAGLTVSGGGGGIYISDATTAFCEVSNCILWDNVATASPAGSADHDYSGKATYLLNCCLPVALGQNPVTADPLFKDAEAGDYRIGAGSPCAYSGLYQAWMDGATDFFGNPRATPGKKVSIGFCQAPVPGLLLFVR